VRLRLDNLFIKQRALDRGATSRYPDEWRANKTLFGLIGGSRGLARYRPGFVVGRRPQHGGQK
jgi:hypothetical protein